ncbi:MAG: NUDIX domain-containing protein [Candidatus Pacearchaeota archaeon]
MKTLDIVVAAYIVRKENDFSEVLLVNHAKLNKWLPVGGHINENEIPDDALRREVMEELGANISFLHYPSPRKENNYEYALPFYVNKHRITDDHEHYCLFYLCSIEGAINYNTGEVMGYKWFRANELDRLNFNGIEIPDSVRDTGREAITLAENLNF